jgi:hypothetical protein
LSDERLRIGREIRSEGIVERNFLGAKRAFCDTNEHKILRHLAILDQAIVELKKTSAEPVDDVGALL